MVDEEILGGLKSAIARGESLEKAMMSFYNAGYEKFKIEEAARSLSISERQSQKPVAKKKIFGTKSKPFFKRKEPEKQFSKQEVPKRQVIIPLKSVQKPKKKLFGSRKASKQVQKQIKQPKQKVSGYGEANPKEKMIIIVLILILIFLFAILATIFFFREELVEIFNSLFL